MGTADARHNYESLGESQRVAGPSQIAQAQCYRRPDVAHHGKGGFVSGAPQRNAANTSSGTMEGAKLRDATGSMSMFPPHGARPRARDTSASGTLNANRKQTATGEGALPAASGKGCVDFMDGPCFAKMLAPNHIAGAIIGKEGVTIGEILLISRCQIQISEPESFFPWNPGPH